MKNETQPQPKPPLDLFEIADEITAELVNLEQVRYLLDVIATDFQKIEQATAENCTYYKNRLSQFIELAKAQLTDIDNNISAAVEDIMRIYANK